MSRITVSAAIHAAEKMVGVVFNENIKDAEDRVAKYVDFLYEQKVPTEIRDLSKNYPDWVIMDRVFEFKFENKRITGHATTEHVSTKPICISELEFKRLKQLKEELVELRTKRNDYARGIKKYLLDLMTTKRVKEEFPEALEYLGDPPVAIGKSAYKEFRTKIRNAKGVINNDNE